MNQQIGPVWNSIAIRCILAVILATGVLLPFFSHTEVLWPLTRSWHEILVLAGLVLNLAFLVGKARAAGKTATARIETAFTWKELLFWNGAGVLVLVLLIRQATTYVVAWGLMIGLRIVIPGMWFFLIAASPFACWEIRHRRKRRPSSLVKFWFSLWLFAALSESASLLILRVNRTAGELVTFPESLPQADDDSLHIASTGGSTTLGWPWRPYYSFSKVAAWQLERSLSQHGESAGDGVSVNRPGQIVVHNVARQGDALREDIRQLHRLSVRPDVLMVYTGHNELYQEIDEFSRVSDSLTPRLDHFLSISPTFRLTDAALTERFNALWRIQQLARRLVDVPYLTPEQHKKRLARFTDRLRQLSGYCKRQNITLIWFIPAAAESSCPPNRSTIQLDDGKAIDVELETAYEKARSYEQQQAWPRAAELYEDNLRDYPEMAEFHYRLGHCLLHMNKPQNASAHFRAALETDAFPVRAQADYRQAVELVAHEYGNITIDAAALLRPLTSQGILDDTVMLDDVHPTLRGTFVLGTEAARVIRQIVTSRSLKTATGQDGSFRESLNAMNIDPVAIANAYETLAGVMPNRARLRFDRSHWNALADRLRVAAKDLRGQHSLPDRTQIESLQNF